jgi:hypothetical protein
MLTFATPTETKGKQKIGTADVGKITNKIETDGNMFKTNKT